MRIIAGKYRHRNILWPEDENNIRPTKDRIREAIFSALGDINGNNVLDLFAGSGAMGIEALSRGANFATFVDINSVAIKTIKTNLSIVNEPYEIINMDSYKYLSNLKENSFDLIILDPPYEKGDYDLLIKDIISKNILTINGVIVIESNKVINYDKYAFKKIKRYSYGEINVDILWR